MPTKAVPAQTIRNIITLRGISHLSYRELSRLFNVSSSTVGKYLYSFERSSLSLAKMRRLDNKALVERLSPPRVRPPKCRHNRLLGLFPDIHQSPSEPTTSLLIDGGSTIGNNRMPLVIPALLSFTVSMR